MAFAIAFLMFLFAENTASGLHNDKHIFTYETDKGAIADVYLVYTRDTLAEYYYCDIKTPICLENLCNPIEIRLEWDLLGNFRNFREPPGKEITKFDHEPFEQKDYEQLKAILSDRESMLKDYRIEDLVDTTKKVYSTEIDALTAATSTSFADKLVPGAIYTCYTLWHLVNGEISGLIRTNTAAILNIPLRRRMLLSGKTAYQDYILDRLETGEFTTDLLKLIKSNNPFIAIKSIRKLPGVALIKEDALQIIRDFDSYELPVQRTVIQYFLKQECDRTLLQEWVNILDRINDIHKVSVYKIFEQNLMSLRGQTRSKLKSFLSAKKGDMDGHDRRMMVLLSSIGDDKGR